MVSLWARGWNLSSHNYWSFCCSCQEEAPRFYRLKQGNLFMTRKLRRNLQDLQPLHFSNLLSCQMRLPHFSRVCSLSGSDVTLPADWCWIWPAVLSCSQLLLKIIPPLLTPDLQRATRWKCMATLTRTAWKRCPVLNNKKMLFKGCRTQSISYFASRIRSKWSNICGL